MQIKSLFEKYLLHIAWLQAFAATMGSLFASEVMRLPACSLCWYQRILMYPLILIIAVGMIKKDKNLPLYVLPLSILGFVLAFTQYLLQLGLLPKLILPCSIGEPCNQIYIQLFGFITLPFLSMIAFLVISLCLIIYWKNQVDQKWYQKLVN